MGSGALLVGLLGAGLGFSVRFRVSDLGLEFRVLGLVYGLGFWI